MAWTATLREAKLDKGKWDVSITYTNGTITVVKGYTMDVLNDAAIKAQARSEVDRFTYAESGATSIPNGASIDLTPPTPPTPPTQAEIDWFANFAQLRRYRKLADSGLMSQNDSAIAALETTLKATYLPAYLAKVSA